MIKYALRCDVAHEFEAWFPSSEGYDDQAARGLIECPQCGSVHVAKAIMAPRVHTSKGAETLAEAQKAAAEALYRLRRHVESTHENVGSAFATEARDIHDGVAPERPIYGQATHDEVKSLVEDGVPVAALPVFTPARPEDAEARPLPPPAKPAAIDKKLN